MSEMSEKLEDMCLKGELFDYKMSVLSRMRLMDKEYTYKGKYVIDIATTFKPNVEEWILENLDTVYINPEYNDPDVGLYEGDWEDNPDAMDVVMLYFSSDTDMAAFILRWT